MLEMKTVRALNLVGREIDKHLKRLKWTIRRLSEASGVPHPTISRLMRGVHVPTPETLDAIGRALGVDPVHLMRLAGIPLPVPVRDRDATIEYIALRLSEIPESHRQYAVNTVAMAVDMWSLHAQGLPANGNGHEADSEAEQLAQIEQDAEDEPRFSIPPLSFKELAVMRAALNVYIELAETEREEEQMGGKKRGDRESTGDSFGDALRDAPVDVLRKLAEAVQDALSKKQPQKIEVSG
jgi:transcriptional regulator with XRE-family HTH domain